MLFIDFVDNLVVISKAVNDFGYLTFHRVLGVGVIIFIFDALVSLDSAQEELGIVE